MKNQTKIRSGIYPTMITPYTKENCLDEKALRQMVQWYARKGCHGIFVACQSSEVFYLTPQECKRMVEIAKEEALSAAERYQTQPMTIVASGHISEKPEVQAREISHLWEVGADAVVLISNRMDIDNTNEDKWISDLKKLLQMIPEDIPLGIYECPTPYKRLLSMKMLQVMVETGRFCFFKDTCCNPEILRERLAFLKGSRIKLFNANAQTLLYSLITGASGYCGVMANFHPELYVWLYENYQADPEKSSWLENQLSMSAFSETLAYPITAKFYARQYEDIPMELFSRSCVQERFTEYDKMVMGQLKQWSLDLDKKLGIAH